MIYYFSGEERYLMKKELTRRKTQLECPDLCYMEYQEWSEDILLFVESYPFVGEKKICVLWFFPENELLEVFEQIPKSTDVYLVPERPADRRKEKVRKLLRQVQEQKFDKVSEDILMKCIYSRLGSFGYEKKQIEMASDWLRDAFQVYYHDLTCDLQVVQTHVDMLGFADGLTKENIQRYAPNMSAMKGYRLSTMLFDQNEECLGYAARLLEDKRNQPIGLLSLLISSARICYKASLFQDDKNGLSGLGIRPYQLYANYRRYTLQTWKVVYQTLQDGVNRLKAGSDADSTYMECLASVLLFLKQVLA